MRLVRIEIDRSLCSGYGICVDTARGAIELDDDGIAVVRDHGAAGRSAEELARSCPMAAITVVEELEAA